MFVDLLNGFAGVARKKWSAEKDGDQPAPETRARKAGISSSEQMRAAKVTL